MRVHGDKYIKRRTNILPKDCQEYRKELEEDFYGLCGYCGKNQYAFNERFEIEHFEIYGITGLGRYICKELKFDIRPMSMVWKVNKLNELKEKLESDDTLKGLKEYKEIDKEIKSLLRDLVYQYKE